MAAAGQMGAVIADHTDIIAVLVAAQALLGLNRLIARDRYPLADYWPGAVQALQWQGRPLRLADRSGPYRPLLQPGLGHRRRGDGPHPAVDVDAVPGRGPAVDRATGVWLCLERASGGGYLAVALELR